MRRLGPGSRDTCRTWSPARRGGRVPLHMPRGTGPGAPSRLRAIRDHTVPGRRDRGHPARLRRLHPRASAATRWRRTLASCTDRVHARGPMTGFRIPLEEDVAGQPVGHPVVPDEWSDGRAIRQADEASPDDDLLGPQSPSADRARARPPAEARPRGSRRRAKQAQPPRASGVRARRARASRPRRRRTPDDPTARPTERPASQTRSSARFRAHAAMRIAAGAAIANSRMLTARRPAPMDADERQPRPSPWSQLIPSSRHSIASENAGTSVMKLAVSRAYPGMASTSRTTNVAAPVATNRRASRYMDTTPITPMASPNALNAHGLPPDSHKRAAPSSVARGRRVVAGHVHDASAEQAARGPHVDPVVIARDRRSPRPRPTARAEGPRLRCRRPPSRARPGDRSVEPCLRQYSRRNPG